jgi:ribulose-bisphosphate carboxylase small chain
MTPAGSTQRMETFSYLPPFSEGQLAAQIDYILGNGLAPAIEYAADPGPRSVYWSMWKLPMFDVTTADEVLSEIAACAEAHPDSFVKLNGYDPKRQGQVASFVVRHPD